MSPGAYASITKVDFKTLDRLSAVAYCFHQAALVVPSGDSHPVYTLCRLPRPTRQMSVTTSSIVPKIQPGMTLHHRLCAATGSHSCGEDLLISHITSPLM